MSIYIKYDLGVKILGYHNLLANNLALSSHVLLCTYKTDCLNITNIGEKA
jgi:hypothetical protein